MSVSLINSIKARENITGLAKDAIRRIDIVMDKGNARRTDVTTGQGLSNIDVKSFNYFAEIGADILFTFL